MKDNLGYFKEVQVGSVRENQTRMREYTSMMNNMNELTKKFEQMAKKFEKTEEAIIETARISYLNNKKP